MKVADLPAFAAILDAHRHVLGAADGYEGGDGETGIGDFGDETLARNWIEALPTGWDGDAADAPYIAPLAEIVRRISALSGEPCPDLDTTEAVSAAVVVADGFHDDG
jgi:hypothetical protein